MIRGEKVIKEYVMKLLFNIYRILDGLYWFGKLRLRLLKYFNVICVFLK